jgi:ATP-binding cassette, subfamily B, multidrug efflux pump
MSSTGLVVDDVTAEPRSLGQNLVRLVKPWRGRAILVVLFVLGAAALELFPPFILRTIVDDHLTVGRPAGLPLLASVYLAASAGVQVMTFLYSYLAATISQGVLAGMRVRLLAHLHRLPTSYFDRTPLGDIISRCTSDVEMLETVFSSGVAVLVANLVRLLTIGAGMVVMSPRLALVAALVLPPLVWVLRFLQVRVRHAERANRIAVGAVTARLQESLRGTEIIRAFEREQDADVGFRRALGRSLAASNRATLFSAFYTPVTAILSALAVAFLLAAGTQYAAGAFGVSIGTLAAFLILLQRFFQPITALGEEWQTVQGAMASGERIFETLALPPDVVGDGPARTEADDRRPPIDLRDVVFGYGDVRPVLRGISLTVAAGEHVAIVGRTGAGKTSLLHLLGGLYAPQSGIVRVSGFDPRRLTDAERRQRIGMVPQVVQLFSGTVFDNLTLGDVSVRDEAVYEAARVAGADQFIRALPQGYRTLLSAGGGGKGTQLSAGQQQFVALARALVYKPAVLLLDEATAAIDNASDSALRVALRESVLARGCAVLTVAHRLSSAIEADRVVVLDRGEIVEQGPPGELARRSGRFAALLELEAAGWDWQSTA